MSDFAWSAPEQCRCQPPDLNRLHWLLQRHRGVRTFLRTEQFIARRRRRPRHYSGNQDGRIFAVPVQRHRFLLASREGTVMPHRGGTWMMGVLLLLGASTGVNVLQAQKIRTLVNQSGQRSLLVGKRVGNFEATTLDGERVKLSFANGLPTVFYYFSTSCGWCERNWANVEALSEAASGRFRIVALSTEKGLKGFVKQRGLRVEMFEQLSEEAVIALRLGGTPTTFAIGADGVITHEWRGAYMERLGRQIEDLFDVTLPGLSQRSDAEPEQR